MTGAPVQMRAMIPGPPADANLLAMVLEGRRLVTTATGHIELPASVTMAHVERSARERSARLTGFGGLMAA
jgi:hypothetical protein